MIQALRLACLGLALVCTLSEAWAREPAFPQELAAKVDERVQADIERQGLVGLAVGIVRGGEIVLLKGYGVADRKSQVPVTPQSIFNWASNSKPLAAVAAMQLVERGKLDLDADVRKYVPEFPDKEAKVTTRQLLCHQSGIPHYSNGRIIPSHRDRLTTEAWLDPLVGLSRFDRSPLLFAPGEKTSYSSYAYILLSAVIQRAGNQSFVEQVQERIANPLQMTSLQLDMPRENQAHWVTGYDKNVRGQIREADEAAHYWKHGAGAYKSDVQDFCRWAQGLINHKLLSPETESKMYTLQYTSNGKHGEYGLGVRLKDQSGLLVSHGGRQDETTTHLVVCPEEKCGVVVMCNCNYGKPAEIADAILANIRPAKTSK